jgi:hypothetical protein
VVGELILDPIPGEDVWRYEVDLDADGTIEFASLLTELVELFYRFETPGVHPIRIRLTFEEFEEEVERLAVVNDPDAIEVLAERKLPDPGPPIYEGITIDHAGEALYVGNYWEGILYRIDPTTLADLTPPIQLNPQIEGLATAPSDSLLFVARKNFAMSIVAIPSMEFRRRLAPSGFFVKPLSESTIVVGGQDFGVFDFMIGDFVVQRPDAWHFSISPDQSRIAALDLPNEPFASLYTLPDLVLEQTIRIDGLEPLYTVQFDPSGEVFYVMGWTGEQMAIVVIDAASGVQAGSTSIPNSAICHLCAANPTAVSANGRYIAFEGSLPGLVIVDTELRAPRFELRGPVGGAVTASPTEPNVFFTVSNTGLLAKIRIRDT